MNTKAMAVAYRNRHPLLLSGGWFREGYQYGSGL